MVKINQKEMSRSIHQGVGERDETVPVGRGWQGLIQSALQSPGMTFWGPGETQSEGGSQWMRI
jgi:hypothetical protein